MQSEGSEYENYMCAYILNAVLLCDICYPGHGMEWDGKWNEMERKFWYGIWKMPECNGMEDFKNGMEDNLPYQFYTRFR